MSATELIAVALCDQNFQAKAITWGEETKRGPGPRKISYVLHTWSILNS